jgi:ankyrin repeat protein
MYASKYGKLRIVQYLLLQTNIDITLKNNKGDTALSLAMKNGHRDVVNVLRYGPSYVVNP